MTSVNPLDETSEFRDCQVSRKAAARLDQDSAEECGLELTRMVRRDSPLVKFMALKVGERPVLPVAQAEPVDT